MTHTLMKLPFDLSALEPYISKETLEYHYGKHHAGYVAKLNALIKDTACEDMQLEDIIKVAESAVFNNAAQVYNHDFYFKGMSSEESQISGPLSLAIIEEFGSLETFKDALLQTGANLFGAGWVWLCVDENGKLIIKAMSNAGNPLLTNHTPILTCDVWEHAYYLDYKNARADYLEQWWRVINWNFASENFEASTYHQNEYKDPCNNDSELCQYLDNMQKSEHTST